MLIREAVVHRISKNRNGQTELKLRTSNLPLTETAIRLITEIHRLYTSKSGKMFGVFRTDATTYPVSGFLKNHIDKASSFLEFTEKSMRIAKSKIETQNLATGGYFLFSKYKIDEIEYLSVVTLNDTQGASIDENTLEINDSFHLNLEDLHLASLINISNWLSGDSSKYVSFANSRSGKGISKYFQDFIGCDDTIDSRSTTENLVYAIKDYCKSNPEINPETTKEKVFLYCKEKIKDGKPVFISDLSRIVNEENPDSFLEYANNEERKITGTFSPDRYGLRGLTKFSLKLRGISVSIDSNMINQTVFYDSESGTLTIKIPSEERYQITEQL